LNSIDPNVTCRKNGSKWGGSDDIGGSPRGVPTKLTPKEIVQACHEASRKIGIVDHMIHFFYALLFSAVIIGAASICEKYIASHIITGGKARFNLMFASDLSFFIGLTFFTALSLVVFSGARWRQFGIRVPTGKDWWLLLPIVILAAFAKGVYTPKQFLKAPGFDKSIIYMIIATCVASELLFRSLAHGILAKGARIQTCRSDWFFSYPAVASAFLYAAFIVYLLFFPNVLNGIFRWKVMATCLIAAFIFGIAAGFVRERAQSVFPAILFHAIAVTVFIRFGFYFKSLI
jgi:hypothetical protein